MMEKSFLEVFQPSPVLIDESDIGQTGEPESLVITHSPTLKQKSHQPGVMTCDEIFGIEQSEKPKSDKTWKQKRQEVRVKRDAPYHKQTPEEKARMRQSCTDIFGDPLLPEYDVGATLLENFANLLTQHSIKFIQNYAIGPYTYDFYIPDCQNLLIDINTTITHNLHWIPEGDHISTFESDYLRKKTFYAKDNGYHDVNIFDWDDPQKIIDAFVVPKPRIFARNTFVQEVPLSDVKEFLKNNHIQGSTGGQKICIGLYAKSLPYTIVSLMTFGKPRYNRNFQCELLRYASSHVVIGGTKKISTYFIETYHPRNMISYCDRSKFNGDAYYRLGFNLRSAGECSLHWYSPQTKRHITDNLLRKLGYDKLFDEDYGKGTSNTELIINRGFLPVPDCGQDTFEWYNPEFITK